MQSWRATRGPPCLPILTFYFVLDWICDRRGALFVMFILGIPSEFPCDLDWLLKLQALSTASFLGISHFIPWHLTLRHRSEFSEIAAERKQGGGVWASSLNSSTIHFSALTCMLYLKKPYSTPVCHTASSQGLFCARVIEELLKKEFFGVFTVTKRASSFHLLVPQLVICLVSHSASWDPLGDGSEFVVFSQKWAPAEL